MTASGAEVDTLVVGAGGVGGHLAATLAAGGASVAVVARGANLSAISTEGLVLRDPLAPGLGPARLPAAESLGTAPTARRLALAVKHPALAGIAAELPAYLGRCPAPPAIVTLQNGVAQLDGPLRAVADSRLVVGAVYIFSHLAAPGVVEVTGGPRLYRLGAADPSQAAAVEAASASADAWSRAGLRVDLAADGRRLLWEKLAILAPLSGLTSLTSRTVGELRTSDAVLSVLAEMVDELVAIAAVEGVVLDEGFGTAAVELLRATDAAGRSSLHLDLSSGREGELEVLLGDPARRAARHGIPAPVLRTVYAATRARWIEAAGS